MSGLGVPLELTVGTNRYTRKINELTFRAEAPGGVRFITFDIPMDVYAPDTNLALFTEVLVSDARSGTVQANGYIADVAEVVNEQGPAVRVTAWGPKVHASEQSAPWIYKDTRVSTWELNTPGTTDGIQVTEIEDTDDDGESRGFKFKAGTGDTITTSDEGYMEYRQLYYCGQRIGRVSGNWSFGFADGANYRGAGDGRATAGGAWGTDWFIQDSNTSGSFIRQVTTHITDTTESMIRFRFIRNTSSITGAKSHWFKLWNLHVYGQRYKDDGTLETTGGQYTQALSDLQVVNDLLGRLLPRYEKGSVTSLISDLGHFAYYDSATAEEILNDLMAAGSQRLMWLTTPAQYYGGKPRFSWWVDAFVLRYELPLDSGADAQKSITELYNKVTVRWKDKKGRPRNTIRTTTGDLLTANGQVRQAFIDVGSTVNTLTTAQAVGDTFLAAHSKPVNNSTITVNRPTLDYVNGNTVHPWQIQPDELVRLRGGAGEPLTLFGDDAKEGIGRIVAVDYTASTNTATLELNLEPRNVSNALRKLERRQVRRA